MIGNNKLFSVVINFICLVIFILTTVFLIVRWNAMGKMLQNAVEGENIQDNRGVVIMLLVLSLIMYGTITLIEHFPSMWNTGIKITEQNKEAVYALLKRMIAVIKLEVLLLFASIAFMIMFDIEAWVWFNVITFIAMGVTIVVYLIRLYKLR